MGEIPFQIRLFETVDSTNNKIKQAIEQGENEGVVVVAQRQEGGYGRQGRSWKSPVGGLYLSILLRPQFASLAEKAQRLPSLGLVISIAVWRTIKHFSCDEAVKIKWPNDIVYTTDEILGKLVGISVEALAEAVCVGIGLNVFRPSEAIEAGDKYTLTYLEDISDKPIEKMEDIISVLLHEVECVYNKWLTEGFSPFRDEYQANTSLFGRSVQVLTIAGDVMYEGVVCDFDEAGLLCLKEKTGTIVRVNSGEVHLA